VSTVPPHPQYRTRETLRRDLAAGTRQIRTCDCARAVPPQVAFVQLRGVGRAFPLRTIAPTRESTVTDSEILAPVAGAVTDMRPKLERSRAAIHADPYDGRLLRIRTESDALHARNPSSAFCANQLAESSA